VIEKRQELNGIKESEIINMINAEVAGNENS